VKAGRLFGRTVRRHPRARHGRHRPDADSFRKRGQLWRAPDRGADRRRRAQWLVAREDALKGAASLLRTTPDEVETRVAALLDERRKLERELAEAKKALALGGGGAATGPADEDVGGVKFSGQVLDGLDPKELRGLLDQAKQRLGSGVAVIVAVNDGRASIAAAVTDDLTGRSARSTWFAPASRRWAARAAAAAPTWRRAAVRTATRRQTRLPPLSPRWRADRHPGECRDRWQFRRHRARGQRSWVKPGTT
jgi:hypothetical protein